MSDPTPDKPASYYEPVGHVVPAWLLIAIFLALISLTWLTVQAIQVDLGAYNIWIAISIAGAKAILVALFFMHLWWDKPFNSIVFITALVFLVLFISLVLVDTTQYQHSIFERPPPLLQH
jgi:cytochrome c oxidase subunit IV